MMQSCRFRTSDIIMTLYTWRITHMAPIALQLYSLREDCPGDFPGVLKSVAEMGYDGVEFAGYHGFEATELKKILDDLGLKVAGTHTGIDTLLGDEFEKTVEFNKILENKFLIVPGLPEERTSSIAAWLDTAEVMNDIAAKLKEHGMATGYHNHWVEFTEMDGKLPWDEFFAATSEDVVMQLDTGNAMHGGAEPLHYLEKFPGRARTVHLKEFKTGADAVLIGDGEVDWAKCFKLCETVGGTEWYIVEQESYPEPNTPMESVKKCIDALKAMRS